MFRTFEPCKAVATRDRAGVIAQSSERISGEGVIVEATCSHECHEAERPEVWGGGEAGC